jgi:hypothetical protein
MQLLSEGFDENAKGIDDDGGIAKTKTDSRNYDNPPAVEKLRMLAGPRLVQDGWHTEIRVFVPA